MNTAGNEGHADDENVFHVLPRLASVQEGRKWYSEFRNRQNEGREGPICGKCVGTCVASSNVVKPGT